MELPPYPERKIRNIQTPNRLDKKILQLQKIIIENPDISNKEIAQIMEVSSVTIRNWLKKYNTDWLDFKTICLRNNNPLTELTPEPKIYQPDLTLPHPKDFQNHIYIDNNRRSKYRIKRQGIPYGSYPTREIAEKVVKYLYKYDWDKKQLPEIYKLIGFKTVKRNNIYKQRNKYIIRKKINGKTISFGLYKTHELACIARSIIEYYDWKITSTEWLEKETNYIYNTLNILENTMFKRTGGF